MELTQLQWSSSEIMWIETKYNGNGKDLENDFQQLKRLIYFSLYIFPFEEGLEEHGNASSDSIVCLHGWRLVTQSCLILWDPIYCSLPGSSVHGILQARIMKWVAISFSRESFWRRAQTWVFHTAGRFFTICTTREACGASW